MSSQQQGPRSDDGPRRPARPTRPIARSQADIDRVLNWAAEGVAQGTRYSGMSYEEGVQDALMWLFGDWSDAPDAE